MPHNQRRTKENGNGQTACSSGPVRVHGADVSVDDTRIRVYDGHHDGYYDDDYHGGQRGRFCPPGQAKKGRC